MWGGGGGGGGCCEECRRRCRLIHAPVSSNNSFFKVLIGPDFSDLLYIPPMFAPRVSGLVGQKVVLEDSLGNRWMVKLTQHRGSLALRNGWRDFLSDHSLRTGDFLVFHFLGSHFLVKIYDRTACEKTVFGCRPDRDEPPAFVGKDFRTRRCSDPRSHLSSNTDVESEDEVVFLASRDRSVVDVPVSEVQVDVPVCGRGRRAVGGELDSRDDAGTTQTPKDGAQAKMAAGGQPDDSVEILDVNPLAVAIYDANAFAATVPAGPSLPDSALGFGSYGERSMTKKRGRPRKDSSNTSIKSETSSFRNLSYDKDSTAILKLTGESSLIPVEAIFSLKVTVASTSYLELPVNLLSILPKSRGVKKSREARVMILEDQLKRWWPVLYREEQVKFLSTGWKCFSEANHISPGDECLLVACDLSKAIFGVSILTTSIAHSPA